MVWCAGEHRERASGRAVRIELVREWLVERHSPSLASLTTTAAVTLFVTLAIRKRIVRRKSTGLHTCEARRSRSRSGRRPTPRCAPAHSARRRQSVSPLQPGGVRTPRNPSMGTGPALVPNPQQSRMINAYPIAADPTPAAPRLRGPPRDPSRNSISKINPLRTVQTNVSSRFNPGPRPCPPTPFARRPVPDRQRLGHLVKSVGSPRLAQPRELLHHRVAADETGPAPANPQALARSRPGDTARAPHPGRLRSKPHCRASRSPRSPATSPAQYPHRHEATTSHDRLGRSGV